MTELEITALIANTPSVLALVPDTVAIAAALSAGRTKVVSHFTSERGILERYPGGPVAADILLSKLEVFAASAHPLASIVKRALKFLAMPEGLDLGAPATQGLLSMLAGGGVISAIELSGLVTMATAPAPITEYQVRQAIFNDDGSLKV